MSSVGGNSGGGRREAGRRASPLQQAGGAHLPRIPSPLVRHNPSPTPRFMVGSYDVNYYNDAVVSDGEDEDRLDEMAGVENDREDLIGGRQLSNSTAVIASTGPGPRESSSFPVVLQQQQQQQQQRRRRRRVESIVVQAEDETSGRQRLLVMPETHCHSHMYTATESASGEERESGSGEGGAACRPKRAQNRGAERTLMAVALLSLFFILLEFTGGVLAHSLAIMTDAGHMLSDLLSFVISIVAIRIARAPATKRMSYGFDRAEIIGATVSIIIIWVLTTVLVMLAIERIVEDKLDVDPNPMLITAGAGVIFNIIMAIVLHRGKHAHTHGGLPASHGHSHGGGHGHGHGGSDNVNVRAAFIHVIGDLVQSVGVLIAALVIKFTGWQLADPICTFLFSVIVLCTTVTVIRDIILVLMEATPSHIDYSALASDLVRLRGVRGLHNLHVWSLNTSKTALSVHLAIDDPTLAVETVRSATQLARRQHGVHLATVQVELYEQIMRDCDYCKPPVGAQITDSSLQSTPITGGQPTARVTEEENEDGHSHDGHQHGHSNHTFEHHHHDDDDDEHEEEHSHDEGGGDHHHHHHHGDHHHHPHSHRESTNSQPPV